MVHTLTNVFWQWQDKSKAGLLKSSISRSSGFVKRFGSKRISSKHQGSGDKLMIFQPTPGMTANTNKWHNVSLIWPHQMLCSTVPDFHSWLTFSQLSQSTCTCTTGLQNFYRTCIAGLYNFYSIDHYKISLKNSNWCCYFLTVWNFQEFL